MQQRRRLVVGGFALVFLLSGCGQGSRQVSLATLLTDIVFGVPKPKPAAPPPVEPTLPPLALPDNSTVSFNEFLAPDHPYRAARSECPQASANASVADPTSRFVKGPPAPGAYLWSYQRKVGTSLVAGFENHFIRVTKPATVRPATLQEQQTSSGGTGTPNSTYMEFEYDLIRPYPEDDLAPIGWEVDHFKVKQGDLYYDAYDPESGLVLASVKYVDSAGKELPGTTPFSPPSGQGLLLFPLPRITGLEPSVITYLAGPGAGVGSVGNPREFRAKSADPATGEAYAVDGNVSADPDVVDACGTLIFSWGMDITVVHTAKAGATPTTQAFHWDNSEQKLNGLFTRFQPNPDPTTQALPDSYVIENIGQLDPGPLPTNLPPAG